MNKKTKVLIINNESKHIKKLENLVKKQYTQVDTFLYSKVNLNFAKKYDLIILSGSTNMGLFSNLLKLKNEMEIIKKSNKPIIGICFGFQIIAFLFGVKLHKQDKKVKGIVDIKFVKPFFNMKSAKVYVAYKWYISSSSNNILSIAKSKKDIQIIKHKSKNIYGLQFHPEVLKEGNDGAKIFINLLKFLTNSK